MRARDIPETVACCCMTSTGTFPLCKQSVLGLASSFSKVISKSFFRLVPVMMDEALNYLEKRQVSNFSQCHVSSQNNTSDRPQARLGGSHCSSLGHLWLRRLLAVSGPSMQRAPSGNRQTRELEFLSCPLPQLLILSCLVTYRLHASECVQSARIG